MKKTVEQKVHFLLEALKSECKILALQVEARDKEEASDDFDPKIDDHLEWQRERGQTEGEYNALNLVIRRLQRMLR